MTTGTPKNPIQSSLSPGRLAVALVLGLLGSLFIWIATPYNNFILRTGFISDDYLAPSVLAGLLLLVLIINPILIIIRRSWRLNFKQIALIAGIMFVAASISSMGLLRSLPYALAQQVSAANEWQTYAGYYEEADLPPSLFPGKTGYREENDGIRQFLTKLPKGEPVPWGIWIRPAISWLSFFVFVWMLCISISGIMLPQWQQKERLVFPLTRIIRSIMETPEDGCLLPPLFREKRFWIAAGIVFGIHLLVGLRIYFPEQVPAFQTSWNLTLLFTDEPLSYLPEYIKYGRFSFIIIGVAYFMSTRVSFSICFFMVAYALYTMLCQMYAPPFVGDQITAHRSGAVLTMAITILWLGRNRWLQVLRCTIRPALSETDRRDRNYGYMLGLGLLGMFGWLVWTGVQVHFALLMVAMIFIIQLVVSRMLAETGLPVAGLTADHFRQYFHLIPLRFFTAASAWMLGAMGALIGTTSQVSVTAMAMQSMSLDEESPPRHQWKIARFYVVLLAVGFLICGSAHIYNSYTHSRTLDPNPQAPINISGIYQLYEPLELVKQKGDGRWEEYGHNLPVNLALGAGLAGGLQYASLVMPRWPLHPVGLLLAYTTYGERVWMSVAVGWILRIVLIFFGGARLYRRLKPLFIGLIIGEAGAAIAWFSISGLLVSMGVPYQIVPILP